MIARRPSTCALQSGRTYAPRGKYVVRLEMLIIQGLVWITRKQQKMKWAGVFCGRCAPVFDSIIVIVIVIEFSFFRYGNDNYRHRFRYRIHFGLIVPKSFWFRYPTLMTLYPPSHSRRRSRSRSSSSSSSSSSSGSSISIYGWLALMEPARGGSCPTG